MLRGKHSAFPVAVSPADRLPLEGETIFTRAQIPDYKVDPETGCWVWQKLTLRGYPVSGRTRPQRLYYQRAYGVELTPDVHVHHRCRNTRCLNPEHLEAVDGYDHLYEHAVSKRKLTVDQASQIRELGAQAGVTYAQIAERFDCHESFVEDVLMGRTFREVFGSDPVRPVRTCPQCAVEFSNRKRNARYCSIECRKASQRRAVR